MRSKSVTKMALSESRTLYDDCNAMAFSWLRSCVSSATQLGVSAVCACAVRLATIMDKYVIISFFIEYLKTKIVPLRQRGYMLFNPLIISSTAWRHSSSVIMSGGLMRNAVSQNRNQSDM